ncbi:MAG: sensor histidine kinase [Dermatophilaceae bacterium]
MPVRSEAPSRLSGSAPVPAPVLMTPWQLGERGRRLFDRGLVVALALPLPLYLAAGEPAGFVLGVLQIAPLWWRRRYPGPVFAMVALASLAQVPFVGPPLWSQIAFPVALYSVARWDAARRAAGALAAGIAGSVVGPLDWITGFGGELTLLTVLPYALTTAAIVVTAWALGSLGRAREAQMAMLVERAEQVRRDAEQRVALAASAERARIAREMHDVVAHGLSVVVVQADGARYAAASDPAVAVRTLEAVSDTARRSLDEMRRLLGLLRAEDTGTAPVPRLADLPALVADAGPGVSADLAGIDADLPEGLAVTVYRVVQESLSNIRRHAGAGAAAQLRVHVGADAVEVVVEDDGRGAAASAGGDAGDGRLGLLGMRERVVVHDGTLEAGPRLGGGWRVRAVLPRPPGAVP